MALKLSIIITGDLKGEGHKHTAHTEHTQHTNSTHRSWMILYRINDIKSNPGLDY